MLIPESSTKRMSPNISTKVNPY